MALLDVHGLRQADIRADGRAHEVEDPEGGKNAAVEFAVFAVKFKDPELRIMGCPYAYTFSTLAMSIASAPISTS